jgi:DNA-binding response OmpR family regulator
MHDLSAALPATGRRIPATPERVETYGDLSLIGDGHLVERGGEVVVLPQDETQLMASLVRAQGRVVRRTVLELAAWGIWDTVTPDALDTAINRVRAKLTLLGSNVRITGAAGQGYALSR